MDAVQQFLCAISDRLRLGGLEVVYSVPSIVSSGTAGLSHRNTATAGRSSSSCRAQGPYSRDTVHRHPNSYGRSPMATTCYIFPNPLRGIRWRFKIRAAEYWKKLHQTQHDIKSHFLHSQVTKSKCKTIIKKIR